MSKKIKFYTWDIDIYYPFALVPYHKFYPKMIEQYENIIVDCGVDKWLNTKDREYPYLSEFKEKVLKYGSNKVQFIIPDYPTDVIKIKKERKKWQQIFLERTERNIKIFYDLPNTILSIQYKFENLKSFQKSWNKFYKLTNYMAIGNLCKSKNKTFFRNILKYVHKNNCKNKPIHFFGIGIPLFKTLCNFIKFNSLQFEISFDTTKWSFTDDPSLRKKVNGYICKYPYRQEFLNAYVKKLNSIEEKIEKRKTIMDYV